LNNQLAVGAYDRFKVAVTAGEPAAVAIKNAVTKAGLKVGPSALEERTVSSVGTLARVFVRSNATNLTRTLRVAHQSFGDPGLRAPVIDGVARVLERYNGKIKEQVMVDTLSDVYGGIGAIMTKANNYRKTTGNQIGYCVAAALVDTLN